MKTTLIIGAGKSGVAAANVLAAKGEAVAITDAKAHPELPVPLDPRVARLFGDDEAVALEDVREVVISPGVPLTTALVSRIRARGVPVIAEIELAYRHLRGTVIAITGSNGKSTTTALIGHILREAGREPIVAGNIGEPLIGALDTERDRIYVVELSSFQLETVDTFRADVALLLNITPDHMDRYVDFDAYAAAKRRIFRNQRSGDVAILNASIQDYRPHDGAARTWLFAAAERIEQGAFLAGDELVVSLEGHERRLSRGVLKLQGMANVENALAAWLAARAVGIDDSVVKRAFGSFDGLPHRMVLVRELDGVRFVNDSKGTNVDATLKSLEGYEPSSVLLILGGKDKAGEFERMRELVGRKARYVLTIGAAADRIAQALQGAVAVVPLGDMEKALAWARRNARPGDTVLLSPACASFDQYRNFEHRGQHFEELVRAL
jgi:UDP-N-acetylmuramoylalanine--D-glutamate ligase